MDDNNNNIDFQDKATILLINLLNGLNPNDLSESEKQIIKNNFGNSFLLKFKLIYLLHNYYNMIQKVFVSVNKLTKRRFKENEKISIYRRK